MGFSEALGEAFIEIRASLASLDKDLSDAEKKVNTSVKQVGQNVGDLGKVLTVGVTAPIVAGFGAAAKAAIDFESSFAGVRKTVAGTVDSVGNLTALGQKLSDGFRAMAKEIPINVNELNKIGESAGQLGIKSDNILGFTKVMAELGVTTNLTSDQAATALARLANITQMPQENFDKLGSTIVALGNNFATTEAEIVEMGLRIAGAGKQVGLTEGQILAVGTALSSLGIEAEAGGSAISKVLINMGVAAATGGESLEQFATAAHMSVGQFKTLFERDAAAALDAFVHGLAQTKAEGGNVLTVLEDMDIKEVRMRDAILRLTGSGDTLTSSLKLQGEAWNANSALQTEAAQRFATTESQMTLLMNAVREVGIEFGTALLPIVKDLLIAMLPFIEVLGTVAKWFASLPEPVRLFVVAIAGIAAAIGPVLIIVGQLISAFGLIATVMPTVIGALSAILPFLGPAGLIVAGVAAVLLVWKYWDQIPTIIANVYNAVKTYLMDKFAAAVNFIKEKVGAVTGFFKDMYTAVVGQSYVPDMINGISDEFGRLPSVMVGPAASATSAVTGLFQSFAGNAKSALAGLFSGDGLGSIIGNFATQGVQSMKSFAEKGVASLLGMVPFVGPFLTQFAGPIMDGLGKIGGAIKNLFGGPSSEELEGRTVAGEFRKQMESMLSDTQRAEAGGEKWKESVIAVRDAYIAAGHSEQEALDIMDKLWKAEKQGAGAVEKVIDEINANMRGPFQQAMRDGTAVGRQSFNDLGVSGQMAMGGISDSITEIGQHFQTIRNELGQEIRIPVMYDVHGMPTSGGGGGGQSGGGVPDSEWDSLVDQQFMAIGGRHAFDGEINFAKKFNPNVSRVGEWIRAGTPYDGSFAKGGFIPPGVVGTGLFHGGRQGEIITPVGDLERFINRDESSAASVQQNVQFILQTPIAIADTIREVVYSEVGPAFLDWLEGNKSGANTRMQKILGITPPA